MTEGRQDVCKYLMMEKLLYASIIKTHLSIESFSLVPDHSHVENKPFDRVKLLLAQSVIFVLLKRLLN